MQKWKCYYCSVIYLITVFIRLHKNIPSERAQRRLCNNVRHHPVETINLFQTKNVKIILFGGVLEIYK